MVAADADICEVGILCAQAGIAWIEPLAGPGTGTIGADPVTNIDVERLEGRIGLNSETTWPASPLWMLPLVRVSP